MTSEECIKKAEEITSSHYLYGVYNNMVDRCYNPRCRNYSNYGGRGIKVCERWLEENVLGDRSVRRGFKNFVCDMPKRPGGYLDNGMPEYTLERINNDGNYEPSNCKWATRTEQMANIRNNVNLTYMGKTRNVNEWSRILGMSPATITARINYGWPVDKVLNSKTIRQKELPMNISYYSNRYQVQIGNEYIGKYLTLEEATAALKTFGGDKKHYEVLTGYVDRRGDFIEVGRIIHSKRKPIEHHFIASLLEHNFIREVEADAEQVDALSTMLGGNPLDNFPNIRKEEQ